MPAAYIPTGEKNISLVLSTSARDTASGFSLASLSPVASAAPPSAVASAARRRRHRRAPPPPLLPAERHLGLGGRHPARRHADLGFRRGTGLGPGSAAHRRGWPARGGGVPRTRRGGEFICRSISSPASHCYRLQLQARLYLTSSCSSILFLIQAWRTRGRFRRVEDQLGDGGAN